MPIDFSFLENAAPKQAEHEPVKVSGLANISIRVDADCFLQCDGEYVDLPLKAGMITKTQLPVGQHLLEFISEENPNIKTEKIVDFPESDKNYLVMVNELKAALAPPLPNPTQQRAPSNPFLDQLNQMAHINPLSGTGIPPVPPVPSSPNLNNDK